MQRYKKGFSQKLYAWVRRLHWLVRQAYGFITFYPVYRPIVDHSVYEQDNRYLGSNFPNYAQIHHRVSWGKPIPKPTLVEFEHVYALIGHLDENTDFGVFKKELPHKFAQFLDWFDSDCHHVCATSNKALSDFFSLAASLGRVVDKQRCHLLKWGLRKKRNRIPQFKGNLEVFHYGGLFPIQKGTQDILSLAKNYPSIIFRISADIGNKLFNGVTLPNVILSSMYDKQTYDSELSRSHLLIHPIYGDGWGVGLDALSFATPILVYNSYDKSEMVEDGGTGFLIDIPRDLSFYDGFVNGTHKNWNDYGRYLLERDNSEQVQSLANKLDLYLKNRDLIYTHSTNTSIFFDREHSFVARLNKVHGIYNEIQQCKRIKH